MWKFLGTRFPKILHETRIFQDLFEFCSQQTASADRSRTGSRLTRTVNRSLSLEPVFVQDLHQVALAFLLRAQRGDVPIELLNGVQGPVTSAR